jgi:hypothetical protein
MELGQKKDTARSLFYTCIDTNEWTEISTIESESETSESICASELSIG